METKHPLGYRPLTELKVPFLDDGQLKKFSLESIHAYKVAKLDPVRALDRLRALEDTQVIGADFGGDKGVTKLFRVKDGRLVIEDGFEDYVQGNLGVGYLESLETTAKFAAERGIPVGISWGAPLDGTKPLFHPKLAHFIEELKQKYDGDFRNLVPTMDACLNDGPSGLVSGAIEANRFQEATSVLFPINGAGLGMAVLADNTIYATEAGHVEGVSRLNIYDQHTPCGVFGAEFVCIERLGANKAGIEAQWELLTGHYLRAKEIEDRYKEGNELAAELYDHSALVVAHMIEGTAQVFGIDLSDGASLVVGHGGAFKFPHYGERIQQILSQRKGKMVKLIMTNTYGDKASNACLDGAALAALVAEDEV